MIGLVIAGALAALGCNGLDTSWHIDTRPLPENHPSKGKIELEEHAWRFVRDAEPGETLPGGAKADHFDVLWEWRMEIANISDKPVQVKAGFSLVTADDTMEIAKSEDPPEKDKLRALKPGEKKTFTGKGFLDRKDIPRVARGRGKLGEPTKRTRRTRKGER